MMNYYMPVKVVVENDAVRNGAAAIAGCGTKALIVTGRHSAFENGAYDDVKRVLDEAGIPSVLFSEVEENPSTETVMKIRDLGLSENADFVIGIGGGSPLDAAKAAALMMAHPSWGIEKLYEAGEDGSYIPVIAVPTTCGTGSEVTAVSVLTNHAKKTKGSIPFKIWPSYAFIDGKYLAFASLKVIRNTSVDALCHLLESAFSKKGTELSKMPAKAGLLKWAETKDILTGARPAGPEDFEKLMISSSFAGMAIAQTGTSLPHALGYILTYDTGLPHGAACGYFLPAFVREAPEALRAEFLPLAGFRDADELEEFLGSVLGKISIPQDVLDRTFEAVKSAPAKMHSPSFDVDEAMLKRITFDS
ncbi:MAG: iron-containing alcohol dehydrogenase [Lachnospiraceae bacterium]|nr:iron-containing alcohol dehydrogenase [Lachnospiraceae bacterium]